MTKGEIVLEPLPSETREGFVRRRCRIHRPDGQRELWFDVPATVAPIDSDDLEPYLISVVLDAMANGWSIKGAGWASWTLLSNLAEFQVAWRRWRPNKLVEVAIQVDRTEVRERVAPPDRDLAIAAFTGGVDASCTVWRHHTGVPGHRTRRIATCALVHGFDIALEDQEKFEVSMRGAQATLSSIGLGILPLRTNFRDVIDTNWLDVHGPGIVAALHFLKPLAGACLIGSSKPYDDMVLPYGSNPVSDHLMDSDSFAVLHDGGGYNRTEKVGLVAQWQEGCAGLRVCWKGRQTAANCGKCEKCTRTRLNFLANGRTPPETLGAPVTWADIRKIILPKKDVEVEFWQILETAKRNGISAGWVLQLRLQMAAQPILRRWQHLSWMVRHRLGRA